MKKIIITEAQAKCIITEGVLDSLISAFGSKYSPSQILNLLRQVLSNKEMQSGQYANQNNGYLINKIKELLLKKNHLPGNEIEDNTAPKINATVPSKNCLDLIAGYEAGYYTSGRYKGQRKGFGYPMSSEELNGYPGPEDKGAANAGKPYHKTYGYGLKFTPDGRKYMDQEKGSYTQSELENMFKQKVNKIASDALNYLNKNYGNVVLGQNQLDAIVSACYNFGMRGFFEKPRNSCPNGMGPIIGNNPNDPKVIKAWSTMSDNSKFAKALGERRREEARLYAKDMEQQNIPMT